MTSVSRVTSGLAQSNRDVSVSAPAWRTWNLERFIDINRLLRRLPLAPVTIEIGDPGQFAQHLFVERLLARVTRRLLRDDCERGVADDLGRAPLFARRHAPVDRRLA